MSYYAEALNDCNCGLNDLTQEQKKQFVKEAVDEELKSFDYTKLVTGGTAGLSPLIETTVGNVVEKVCNKGVKQTIKDNALYIAAATAFIGGIGYYLGKK